MAKEVGKVLDRDPERLQFFKLAPYNRDSPGAPVKSTETRIIEEIIHAAPNNRDNRRQRKKMYYQVKIKKNQLKKVTLFTFKCPITDYFRF